MGAEPSSLLDYALWNARLGFRVFPLKPGERTPAFKGWQQDATIDEAAIRYWWERADYNIGVATGQGLVVVDIDVKNGKPGYESFNALGWSLDTFTDHTPSGGLHVYYATDADIRNSVESVAPGVDIRGTGGYVVGAGSVVAGSAYKPNGIRTLGSAPAIVSARPAVAQTAAVTLDAPDAVDRAEQFLREAPPAVEGQSGDQRTFKVAATLKDFGVSEYMAWELMQTWNDRCLPPWSLEELETKVRNAYRYGENTPGSLSPAIDFKDVHIDPPAREGWNWGYHGDAPDLDEQWLLHEMIPAVGTLLMVGPSQSGKTFLITELARCIAAGRPFFGVAPDEPGAVLCLFAGTEGSGIKNRLAALGEPYRLPIAYVNVPSLRQPAALDALLSELRAQAAFMFDRFGLPLRLVVLETISASGMIEKENDANDVATALRNLGHIGQQLGVLFATSHHPPKTGDEARGSGAFLANIDGCITITRDGMDPIRSVDLVKARNAAQRPLGSFTLLPREIGRDRHGRPVISMTVSSGAIRTRRNGEYVHSETLAKAFDLVEEDDIIRRDGKTYVYEEGWKFIFCEIVEGSPNKSNRNKKFLTALKAADEQGIIERINAPAGPAARFILVGEEDDG